jgi:8-oxo-dGTP pyrophosphatase MutT (NUDIX family)
VGLVDRINRRAGLAKTRQRSDNALSWDDYQDYFGLGGPGFPFIQMTMGSLDREKVASSAIAAYKTSGPVFSLILARMQVFSQVKFQWTRFNGSQPGDLFGTPELSVLETPWPGGTTGKLLARMEMHNSLAGNAYIRRTRPDQLNILRPDFVTIILGSQENEADPALAADTEIAGYFYTPAGGKPQIFLPDEVAHFAPIPDPWFHFLGQSWITPVLRDLQADQGAVEHKFRYFENSALSSMAIKFDPGVDIVKVKAFKKLMEEEHRGAFNAFRTLYLGGGADVTTLSSSLKDMDYAVIQGRAESRLAAAAGVPPSWVGFSEGLQGSALNAGNFNSARRRFSDGTLVHLWSEAAASLQPILTAPDSGARLWYDSRVPFMREDAGDLAGIQAQEATTVTTLVNAGFIPETVIEAVKNNDWTLLKHSGLTSVQLLPPSSGTDPLPGFGDSSIPAGTAPPAAAAGGSSTPAGTPAAVPAPKPAKAKAAAGRPARRAIAQSATLVPAPAAPQVAGQAVQAADTGRVLLLQRAFDPTDPAGGMWEFPGGHVEPGETTAQAAAREWSEETGLTLPADSSAGSSWTSPNGVYEGFVVVIPQEAALPIFDRDHGTNPDDPGGDAVEALAWWNPEQLPGCPALRPELLSQVSSVLAALSTSAAPPAAPTS